MSHPRSSGKTSEARELSALSSLVRSTRPAEGTRAEDIRAAAELITLACFGTKHQELLELAQEVRTDSRALPVQCALVAGKVAAKMVVTPLPPGFLSEQCTAGVRWSSADDRKRAAKIAMRVVVRQWAQICNLAAELGGGADLRGTAVASALEAVRSSVGAEPGALPWASEIG